MRAKFSQEASQWSSADGLLSPVNLGFVFVTTLITVPLHNIYPRLSVSGAENSESQCFFFPRTMDDGEGVPAGIQVRWMGIVNCLPFKEDLTPLRAFMAKAAVAFVLSLPSQSFPTR